MKHAIRCKPSTGAILMLAILAVVTACVTNTVTGRTSFVAVPDSVMNSLGAQGFEEIKSQEKESTNARLNAIVRRVADRITAVVGEQMEWEVRLVDSDQVNAFVLPGGKIVVYTGLLPVVENEAGLAFVMGHEVGHAIARHGAERMTQTVGAQVALAVADAATQETEHRTMVMGALGMGAQYGVLLPFSRTHESEADHMGIIYMAKAGYDPKVAPGIWQRMGALGGEEPPEFLSTHPNHDTRTARLRDLIDDAMVHYDAAEKKHGVGERL